jgi:GTP cyclohydrolase III
MERRLDAIGRAGDTPVQGWPATSEDRSEDLSVRAQSVRAQSAPSMLDAMGRAGDAPVQEWPATSEDRSEDLSVRVSARPEHSAA